jgi:hypothetical protein
MRLEQRHAEFTAYIPKKTLYTEENTASIPKKTLPAWRIRPGADCPA